MTTVASTLRSEPSGRIVDAARARLDAGFDALVLTAPLSRQDWELLRPLLPRDSILAVELFLPLDRAIRPERLPQGKTSPFSLGALHAEDKRDAEKHGLPTISFAHHQGARFVLLPPVELEGHGLPRGQRAPEPAVATSERATPRSAEIQAHLDSYLSTLDRLLAEADRYEVNLAITPVGSTGRMPNADDAELCLAEFRGAPLSVWPDMAEQARAATVAPEAVPAWRRFPAVPGVTLRDVDPRGVLCLPGAGSVEWPTLLPELEDVGHLLVDPPRGSSVDEISSALEFLRGQLEPEHQDPLFPAL